MTLRCDSIGLGAAARSRAGDAADGGHAHPVARPSDPGRRAGAKPGLVGEFACTILIALGVLLATGSPDLPGTGAARTSPGGGAELLARASDELGYGTGAVARVPQSISFTEAIIGPLCIAAFIALHMQLRVRVGERPSARRSPWDGVRDRMTDGLGAGEAQEAPQQQAVLANRSPTACQFTTFHHAEM